MLLPIINQTTAKNRLFFRPHHSIVYDPNKAPTRAPRLQRPVNRFISMKSNAAHITMLMRETNRLETID
jgi:hypothetical protein